MYLSIFNAFRVTRCLSQCVSPTRTLLSQTDRASAAHTIRRAHLRDLEMYTLRVTQGHWKRNHRTDHTRLTIRRVIGR